MTEVRKSYHNHRLIRKWRCGRNSRLNEGEKEITAQGMARAATLQHHVVGGKGSIDEVAGNADHVGVDSMIAVPDCQERYRSYTKFVPFAPHYSHMYVHS